MTAVFDTGPLSDLFEGGGALVTATDPTQRLEAADSDAVIHLFERHGALLFRGFDLPPESLSLVTDIYTESYTPDAIRRPRRFGSKVIGNVDVGDHEIGLHSEASFGANWPEVLWFYCNVASTRGAYTTVCDGVRLWRSLSRETQRLFLAQPVTYAYPSVIDEKLPGRGRKPWPFQTVGVDGYWDMENGVADLRVSRFAVQEARTRTLCFANHVFTPFTNLTATWADGAPIAEDVLAEIRNAAKELTYDVRWEARDLLMIDNRRFTHGRRAFDARQDPRDIVQVQTSLASFAWGVTIRKRLAPANATRRAAPAPPASERP